MNPEEKNPASAENDGTKDFGKVIDALHNKSKLSALRSYQGDVAEFIKEKNESVISIAVKEKERKEQREEQEQREASPTKPAEHGKIIATQKTIFHAKPKGAPRSGNLQVNIVVVLISILLLGGGGIAAFYVYKYLQEPPAAPIIIDTEIIPYNTISTVTNVAKTNVGTELRKLSAGNGVTIVKIAGPNGQPFQNTQEFLNFMEIVPPNSLSRTLGNSYAIGVFSQNESPSYFMVLKVNDFGRAFAGMLEWEATLASDLSFLNNDTAKSAGSVSSTSATSSGQAKPATTEVFSWKDVIIKNKDTRGLVNSKNQSKIAYTFLDKNTILITNNISAIGDFASIYASRSVAR